jgi:ribose transport system substrate-binding protein
MLALLALVSALALAACGGGGSSSESTTASESSEEASSGGAEDSEEGEAEGGESSNAAAIEELTTRPTEISVTEPVGGKIPAGKEVVYVPCPSPNCLGTIKEQMEAAAKALNWKLKVVTPTGATASALTEAFHQAVAMKPDGIVYVAYVGSLIHRQLEEAEAAGIPVVGSNTTEPVGSLPGVIAQPINQESIEKNESTGGRLMGLLAEPGDGVTFFEITGFVPVEGIESAVEEGVKETCPTCKYSLKEIDATELAEAPSVIANYFRANPDVKYGFGVDYRSMGTGLSAQLSQLGVTGVNTLMTGVDEQGLEDVQDGSLQVAGSFEPDTEGAYLSMDALARHFVGESSEVDNVPPAPYWFTTENAPEQWSPSNIEDAAEQFEALWAESK